VAKTDSKITPGRGGGQEAGARSIQDTAVQKSGEGRKGRRKTKEKAQTLRIGLGKRGILATALIFKDGVVKKHGKAVRGRQGGLARRSLHES